MRTAFDCKLNVVFFVLIGLVDAVDYFRVGLLGRAQGTIGAVSEGAGVVKVF